eukprot:COSAG06_NODE_40503_length_401_cov_1.029801_1_plen_51_part_10
MTVDLQRVKTDAMTRSVWLAEQLCNDRRQARGARAIDAPDIGFDNTPQRLP